jgi:hypothetical protein
MISIEASSNEGRTHQAPREWIPVRDSISRDWLVDLCLRATHLPLQPSRFVALTAGAVPSNAPPRTAA